MRTIHKFTLEEVDRQEIQMPVDAKVLCLQVQDGIPRIWARVNTDIDVKEFRTFLTFGTGHPMPIKDMDYIGTYQVASGRLVFHVFELDKKPF